MAALWGTTRSESLEQATEDSDLITRGCLWLLESLDDVMRLCDSCGISKSY